MSAANDLVTVLEQAGRVACETPDDWVAYWRGVCLGLARERDERQTALAASERRVEAMREALEALSAKVEREIADHNISAWHWKDHACGECTPDGSIVVAGFRCARHAARAALASGGAVEAAKPPATSDT